jgi:malate permease and related proteins
MAIFSIVFFKIFSLLLTVVIGFMAGRWSKVERDSIASLLFYFIAPIIFFATPASTSLTPKAISFVIVVAGIASFICLFSYYFFGKFWQDATRNILGVSAGNCNVGYFMLPIAGSLFDEFTLSIFMMTMVGINIYESTLGFYVGAMSVTNKIESAKKVLKLPSLNAFVLGCIFSISGLQIPDFFNEFVANMRSTFSILGMIMIGLGISNLQGIEMDFKFTFAAFVAKFVFYPVTVFLFIMLDMFVLKIYDKHYYNALIMLSTAPMGANTIVIASILKFHPQKVAASVLLSCLFCLVYTPAMLTMFMM